MNDEARFARSSVAITKQASDLTPDCVVIAKYLLPEYGLRSGAWPRRRPDTSAATGRGLRDCVTLLSRLAQWRSYAQ